MGHICIYDTTLRDGSQMRGINYSVEDKLKIVKKLDSIGIDYIECGWPSSNLTDIEVFERLKELRLEKSKTVAFGSTRHYNNRVKDDLNIKALIEANTDAINIFGKAWDLHVIEGFGIGLEKNLEMIEDSLKYLKKNTKELFFTAEHFFDGYKKNKEYAVEVIKKADEAGADLVILADTNGGCQYFEISEILEELKEMINFDFGIHVHNDGGMATVNSIEAVRKGAKQVQGTINGYGERCGNANLCEIIPNLQVKLGYNIMGERIKQLSHISKYISELSNLQPSLNMPFVGANAFSHKGGIHVSAVMKNPATYEHINPDLVGNERKVLISDLSGKSNILYKLGEFGVEEDIETAKMAEIIDQLQIKTKKGYDYEGAEASFELLIQKILNNSLNYFEPLEFKVLTEGQRSKGGETEAINKIKVGDRIIHTVAEGNGPINALNISLKKALISEFPEIADVKLRDYKVRIVDGTSATKATTRVLIESVDEVTGKEWSTVGVSTNIIKASWKALIDCFEYYLYIKERDN